MARRPPTKDEYLRAAKIVRQIARNGYSIRNLFKIYLSKRKNPSSYTNIFKKGNTNFDSYILEVWESALSRHRYYAKRHKIMDKVNTSKRITRKAVRNSLLLNHADELKKRGYIQGTVDTMVKSGFFFPHVKPKHRALMVDHLFVSVISDPRKRHQRLLKLFSGKQTSDDAVIVRVIWEYVRQKWAMRDSDKIEKKYFQKSLHGAKK